MPFGEESESGSSAPEASSCGSPPATAPTPGTPPTAADFWGEEAAALHDALQAPMASAERPTVRESRHQGRELRRLGAVRSWRRRASYSTASVAKSRGIPWTRVGIASLAAAVMVAVLVGILTRSSAPPRASRPAELADSHLTMLGTFMSGTASDFALVRRIARHRWPGARRRIASAVRHRDTAPTAQVVSTAREVAPAVTTSAVAAPAAATAATATAASSPSSSGATVTSAPSTAPSSSPPVASAGTQSSTNESSGSTSQPAFGANGSLGPGRSPNG